MLFLWTFGMAEGSAGAQSATDYIRSRGGSGEDPLIETFKEVLTASKEGRWKEVDGILSDLAPVLKKYDSVFGVDLMPRLKKGVDAGDPNEVAKVFAHVLFLGMNENLHLAMKERLENYDRSFHYVATARSYYDRVLAGNIKRKEPSVHDEILRQFEQAQFAIGNPGLLGAGKLDPDPQRFASAAKAIEMNIKRIYTYFTK
jgi:hypothetical protein